MRMTRASQYAVAALVHMTRGDGRKFASHDIARAAGLPELFLLKVLKPLASAGILYSSRGPGGGYSLAKPAKDVTLLAVIEAVDGPVRAKPAADHDGKLGQQLHDLCDRAAHTYRRALARVTLAELVNGAK